MFASLRGANEDVCLSLQGRVSRDGREKKGRNPKMGSGLVVPIPVQIVVTFALTAKCRE
jgi:hypothetical protein